MRIDAEATRSRIHAMAGQDVLAPVPTAGQAHYGYRDNDIQSCKPMYIPPGEESLAQNSDSSNQVITAQPAAEFTDLDSLPLTLASDQEPSMSPSEAPDLPAVQEGTDASPVANGTASPSTPPQVEGQVQSGEEVPQELDPPRMRHIIFLATTLPHSSPPFAKTQPNLGGVGLRYGLGRFTQISGDIGRLLLVMRDADATTFDQTFGSDTDFPNASADELIAVTTALNPLGATVDTAPNMQVVSGKPLWAPEWIRKFKAASNHPPFQDAQFCTAAQTALLPMLDFARGLGLYSEKGMALLAERAIQQGVQSAQEFIIASTGPINTEALKREALVHLADDPNNATLSAFQAAHELPDTAGRLDVITHVALVGALRERGDSPIPLPSQAMMFDQIARAVADSPMPGLIAAIRNNNNLSESPLSAADPVME